MYTHQAFDPPLLVAHWPSPDPLYFALGFQLSRDSNPNPDYQGTLFTEVLC